MLTYAESLRILGLQPGATEKDIKRAFRRLAHQWHPDKFPAGSAEQARATAKFREIREACDVLSSAAGPPPAYSSPPPRPARAGSTYSRRSTRPRPRYSGPYVTSTPRSYSGPIIPTGCSIWIAFILLMNIARCSSTYYESRVKEQPAGRKSVEELRRMVEEARTGPAKPEK